MTERNILYSCVASGPNILAEYSLRSGNFFAVVYHILSALPTEDQQSTYLIQNHYFHFKVYNLITYLCLCHQDAGSTAPHKFLNEICELFDPIRHKKREAAVFGTTLEKKMRFYSNPKFAISQVGEIQAEVDSIKEILVKNIETLMERGQKLEDLEDTAIELEVGAKEMKQKATAVKKYLRKWALLRKLALCGCIFLVIVVVALIIWYFVCGGFSFYSCGKVPTPPPNQTLLLAISSKFSKISHFAQIKQLKIE